MVKKLFALASVTALTGLVSMATVAGCSSTTTEETTLDAGADAKTQKDSAPIGDDEEPTEQLCYKEDPFDASVFKYQPPRLQQGACGDSVLDVISGYVSGNENATFTGLRDAIKNSADAGGQDCADCVFANDGDTWAPLVLEGNKVVAVNTGACVGLVSGKEACGRAFFQWDICLGEVCAECADQSEARSCYSAVQDTACKAASDELLKECGPEINTFVDACFLDGDLTFTPAVRTLCLEPKDAG
ncbi:MAG TPA: hypothetical protein VM580_25245 [Labilithrix sp.]|nr:hypothetical protein [Labilithrix sp.]